jgi:hypothetical protein
VYQFSGAESAARSRAASSAPGDAPGADAPGAGAPSALTGFNSSARAAHERRRQAARAALRTNGLVDGNCVSLKDGRKLSEHPLRAVLPLGHYPSSSVL